MARCPILQETDVPEVCNNRAVYTLIYGEKQARLKALTIDRKITGWRGTTIENRFEAYLGFDGALHLFFSKEFAQYVYNQFSNKAIVDRAQENMGNRRNTYESISCAKYGILKKIYDDFNNDLHPKGFTVLETGMKLRADLVAPVSKYFPPDSTDLLIKGTFEF